MRLEAEVWSEVGGGGWCVTQASTITCIPLHVEHIFYFSFCFSTGIGTSL